MSVMPVLSRQAFARRMNWGNSYSTSRLRYLGIPPASGLQESNFHLAHLPPPPLRPLRRDYGMTQPEILYFLLIPMADLWHGGNAIFFLGKTTQILVLLGSMNIMDPSNIKSGRQDTIVSVGLA
jgi:hypothetical protein